VSALPSMKKETRRKAAIAVLLVILVLAAIYVRVLFFDFVLWDDDVNVFANPHLRESPLAAIGYFWTHAYQSLWIPLTYSVWALLASVAQFSASDISNWSNDLIEPVFNAVWFHAANLVVHIIATLFVFNILRVLCGRGKIIACALGAAIFGLHPLQVESVAWVTGMKDLLSGMLALGAVSAYLKYSGPGSEEHSAVKRRGWYGVASILYLLALCAKPSTVIVPAVVFAIDVLWNKRNWRRTLIDLSPWAFAAILLILATLSVQSAEDFGYEPWPIWSRPLIALDALYWYMLKTLIPIGLCAEYGRSPEWLIGKTAFWVTWLVPVGATLAATWYWRRRGGVLPFLAIVVFMAALLPLLGLLPFVYQGISTVADRYAYLATMAWALAVTGWMVVSNQAWRKTAVTLLLIVYAMLTIRQSGFWQNTEILYARTLEINPSSWLTLYDQGAIALRRNQLVLAESVLRKSISLNPRYADTQSNLGAALANQGRIDEAIAVWRKALELNPVHAGALPNLCAKLMNAERYEEAMDEALAAHEKEPGTVTQSVLARVYYQYGAWSFNKKDYANATRLLDQAVTFDDSGKNRTAASMAHNGLGMEQLAGDRLGAIQSFKEALRYSPENSWAAENLAAALE